MGWNKAIFASFAGEAEKLARGACKAFILYKGFAPRSALPASCKASQEKIVSLRSSIFLLFHNKKADVQADTGYSPSLLHAQKIVSLRSSIFANVNSKCEKN